MRKPFRFLSLLLLTILFASCANAGMPASTAPADTALTKEEPSGSAAEDGTLPEDPEAVSFWAACTGNDAGVLQELVAEYNAAGPEREVALRLFETENVLYQELQAAIALSEAPDIALLNRDNTLDLYRNGGAAEWTPFFGEDGPLSEEVFLPIYLENAKTEEGVMFGLPFYGTIHVMYYNKEAFAAVKLDPAELKTWQDFAEAASLLQRRLVCEEGWELTWGYENMLDAVMSVGGSIYSEDGRTVMINTEEWVTVWEQFRLWLHEDRFLRVHTGGLGDEWLDYTRADVLKGTAGGFTGASADRTGLDPAVIGIMPQPGWDAEHPARPGTRLFLLNIISYSDAAYRAAAADFAHFLTEVPAQVKWTTGTGHISVNRDTPADRGYQEYLRAYPGARVAMEQRLHAVTFPTDPTGGEIRQILSRAADRVLIENIPAEQVLDDAQREAQRALDAVLPPLPEEEGPAPEEAEGEAGTGEEKEETP